MIYSFSDFELHDELFELRCQGQPVPMEPQVFNVLAYLVKNRDRIVSKQELLDNIWQGRVVSESTLNTSIKAVRKAVNDNGHDQDIIATVHRRGYRFIAAAQELSNAADGADKPGHAAEPSSKIDDRISIAVIPFSHDPEDDNAGWLAEVFSVDISIQLARIPGFIVISKNSADYFSDSQSSPQQIGRELDAGFLIEGSVRRFDDAFKISVQLTESRIGRLVWANHKQLSSMDIKDFKSDVVEKIVAQIEPELTRADLSILHFRKPSDLGAWSLYRKANNLLGQKGWSDESFSEVIRLLREAIERDPELAFAHAYLSLIIAIGHLIGLKHAHDWEQHAFQAAETALSLDSQDSDVLGYVGCAFADMGDFQRGIPLIKRAIEINPGNAQAWSALGAAKLRIGDETGFEDMRYGMRISPKDNRLAAWGALLARGLLTFKLVDEAIKVAQEACIYDDKIFLPRIILALAYSTAGSKKASLSAWQDAKRTRPQLCLHDIKLIASPDEIDQLQNLGVE